MRKKIDFPNIPLVASAWGQVAIAAGLVLAPAAIGLSACSSSDCGDARDCFTESESESNEGGQGGEKGGNNGKPEPTATDPQNHGGEGGTAIDNVVKDDSDECVPVDFDKPDEKFADINCDGIDGDKLAAIFVNPQGHDTSDGSFEQPVASISRAIFLARNSDKDIYVCTETYEEELAITTHGVDIYGGYSCEDWRRNNAQATVAPLSGVPLRIESVEGLHIEQLKFVAKDAENGTSAVAGIIKDAKGVTFSRVELIAGRGGAGASGAVGTTLSQAAKGADGQLPCSGYSCVGLGGNSSLSQNCSGTDRSEPGGAGGTGARTVGVALPGTSALSGAAGGAVSSVLNLRHGQAGASGNAGSLGAFAAHQVGRFEQDRYFPTNSGESGNQGSVGKAGGGGAGGNLLNGALASGGGQGGYGGCGGLGGQGGRGGEGSFAIVIVSSQVTIDESQLVTAQGGAGGAGGKGGNGSLGGNGGTSSAGSDLQKGGTGGKGGSGGVGGNGAPGGGGPSIAVALVGGSEFSAENVSVVLGQGGVGGSEPGGSSALPGTRAEAFDFAAGKVVNFRR